MNPDKLLIDHLLYNKQYVEECDTAIHTLSVDTQHLKVIAKITTINWCKLSGRFSSLELLDSTGLELHIDGENTFRDCMMEVQNYLIDNNLLTFVDGFGMKAFDKRLNDKQTKPTSANYDWISEDYYQER